MRNLSIMTKNYNRNCLGFRATYSLFRNSKHLVFKNLTIKVEIMINSKCSSCIRTNNVCSFGPISTCNENLTSFQHSSIVFSVTTTQTFSILNDSSNLLLSCHVTKTNEQFSSPFVIWNKYQLNVKFLSSTN